MSARDFKRRRMALLDALVGHPDQPPNVFRLFYLITGYVNAATGDAWPSQERLARELGLTVRTVRDRTDWLVDNGYLEVTAGRGRSITHRYRMPEPTRQSDLWEDATIVPPPIKAAAAKRKPAPALRPSDNSFETFWQAYPRKIDKAAAQRTFQSILQARKATAAELIDGAERYAQERAGQNPKYTKHPKTWLNAGSWQNEPENLKQTTSTEPGAMSAMRGVLTWKH